MSPGALDRKMCNSSVEPTPSRMSTPKRALPGIADRFRQRLAGGGADAQALAGRASFMASSCSIEAEQRRHAAEDASGCTCSSASNIRAGVGRSELRMVVAPTDIGKVSALPRP